MRGNLLASCLGNPNPQKPPIIVLTPADVGFSFLGNSDPQKPPRINRHFKIWAFLISIGPIFRGRHLASSVLLFFRPTARARNRQRIVCRNELLFGQEPHPSSKIYISEIALEGTRQLEIFSVSLLHPCGQLWAK